MKTTDKAVLYTMGATAGAAVGTFLAGRSMWRGINKAKPIGLLVLAIVAYHTFDSYRESVDTAWGRAENIVERRAAAEAAQKRVAELEAEAAAKTAAFNAQKAEDMRKAEDAYQAALKDQAEAELKRTIFVYARAWFGTGATSRKTIAAEDDFNKAFNAWAVFPHVKAEETRILDDAAVIFKEIKREYSKPKPKPVVAKPVAPEPVVEAKPAPVAPMEPSEVVEARKALKKAKAVCQELYPQYGGHAGVLCNGAAYTALRAAENNYAQAKLAN